jgi:hypothetical protein
MVDHQWSGFGENCEQYLFYMGNGQWYMVDDWRLETFMRNFLFAKKKGWWSMIRHRGDQWKSLVYKRNHRSSMFVRYLINNPYLFSFEIYCVYFHIGENVH